jgi:hypothetical protein
MRLMQILYWMFVAPVLLFMLLAVAYLMWPIALLIVVGIVWAAIRRRWRRQEVEAV